MQISEICIRRPVFATVLNLFVILLGLVAYDRLSVREYPKVDEPTVTVETRYPGASAAIVESQITKPLENSIAGIEGIEVLSSISRQEKSQITVRFKITRDPDNAASDVRDRVGRVRGVLPKEIDEPVIAKVEADAQPIIYLAFSSSKHSPMEISDYAYRFVKDRLQNLDGVADVRIFGERKVSMRIWVDSQKLAAYKLTPQDVEIALSQQNVEIPAGRIESKTREFTVLSETDLRTPEQFDNVIIRRDKDKFVRLKDVGKAEIAPGDVRVLARFNGKDAVALGVVKQATANPLQVSKEVRELMPKIEAGLPQGMLIKVAYDSSVFIDRSIKGVYQTILESVLLVVLVIYMFLRNVRATLIPLVTIPISIIGTFMMMYLLNFTINTLTLLSMVLAIGLVVDDAIVVLENIYRYVEEGMKPIEAAIKGMKEISFAVIAMTMTLAAVYAPVAFMEGTTGKLFAEFAVTLAGAVIISGFIALTLSPMMCSKILKKGDHKKEENFFASIEKKYNAVLDIALNRIGTVIIVGLVVALIGFVFSKVLKSELAPVEDRGTVVSIILAPEGSTIEYTNKWIEKLEGLYKNIPEIEKFFSVAGFPVVSQGISFVRLYDWDTRSRKQMDIVTQLGPQYFMLPGIMAFPVNPPSLGKSARSRPVEFVLMTSTSYKELDQNMAKFMAELKNYNGILGPDIDLKMNVPQLTVKIDRNKAAAVGVDIDTIGRTLETMLGGRQVTRFKQNGEQYDVIVELRDENRTKPSDVSDIYVKAKDGSMVKLANLVDTKETVAPRELNHFNQLRAVKLSANIAPGHTLGEVLEKLNEIAKRVMPAGTQIDYEGESREFKKASSGIMVTMLLALAFIYLVLSAQFESFKSPLIIMLSVPLSMTGALLALFLTGGTLNIYSQVGLITLIGLITKHGILIVEFSNQLREKGEEAIDAVKTATKLRLRPILMTTGAMILGAIPLALASGAGAESRRQIGWVIIGGMSVGTFFTLFVIPACYVMVYGRKSISDISHDSQV